MKGKHQVLKFLKFAKHLTMLMALRHTGCIGTVLLRSREGCIGTVFLWSREGSFVRLEDDNVQVNEVQNDVNQTEVEVNKVQENVTHTEKEVNEGQDSVTHTEVEVEVNETDVNANQTKVPVSVLNSEKSNEAMNDNEAGIYENCETEAVVDSDSSEDSMRDVHFEDNEEERVIGADDGFTMAGMGHNEAEVDSEFRAEDNAGDASGVADRADEEYESKELESDVENIDGNDETKTKYERSSRMKLKEIIEVILPPAYKPGPGRPKKLRRREPDEGRNPTKLSRHYPTTRCRYKHTKSTSCSTVPTKITTGQREREVTNGFTTVTEFPTRVTRASQNSQNSKGTTSKAHETSSNTMNNNKGRKKSNNIGPTIHEFARNVTVSQLVAQLSRVLEQLIKPKELHHQQLQIQKFTLCYNKLKPAPASSATIYINAKGPQQDQNKEGGYEMNELEGVVRVVRQLRTKMEKQYEDNDFICTWSHFYMYRQQ
ncbi:hypothetical protein SESBI_18120 [Sesbania bispinosa]|nr:hypothetical protein SESBI_18120 [Sesbania bispinosa]